MEYFPAVFSWIYKPDGNRKWNIFLRCSVGSTSRMKTENGIFFSGVLLDLQAGWESKMEYFPPVLCWIYKSAGNRNWNIFLRCSVGSTTEGNRKWNIFLRCSVGCTSRMETESGIFSSTVFFWITADWNQ